MTEHDEEAIGWGPWDRVQQVGWLVGALVVPSWCLSTMIVATTVDAIRLQTTDLSVLMTSWGLMVLFWYALVGAVLVAVPLGGVVIVTLTWRGTRTLLERKRFDRATRRYNAVTGEDVVLREDAWDIPPGTFAPDDA